MVHVQAPILSIFEQSLSGQSVLAISTIGLEKLFWIMNFTMVDGGLDWIVSGYSALIRLSLLNVGPKYR